MSGKPSVSTQQQSSQLDTAPNRDEVQERAYYRYLERGGTDGQALDDWLVAETEVQRKASTRAES
jgi:hypothetical protein